MVLALRADTQIPFDLFPVERGLATVATHPDPFWDAFGFTVLLPGACRSGPLLCHVRTLLVAVRGPVLRPGAQSEHPGPGSSDRMKMIIASSTAVAKHRWSAVQARPGSAGSTLKRRNDRFVPATSELPRFQNGPCEPLLQTGIGKSLAGKPQSTWPSVLPPQWRSSDLGAA